MLRKIIRKISIFLLNLLQGTHSYKLKRMILNWGDVTVGEGSRIVGPIYIGSVAKLQIGRNSFIGRELKILGNGTVTIGDEVDIAPDVTFVTGSHEIGEKNHRAGNGISYDISIDDGTWIGARATILGNTIIEKGVVIGAGSLVCKNICKDILAVGVPAKPIKKMDC